MKPWSHTCVEWAMEHGEGEGLSVCMPTRTPPRPSFRLGIGEGQIQKRSHPNSTSRTLCGPGIGLHPSSKGAGLHVCYPREFLFLCGILAQSIAHIHHNGVLHLRMGKVPSKNG